jgi:glycosyltransferase involved in cell wall biosynthesis
MIDIIIPAYNAHNTIENAIISIANQSIRDKFKVYIVNDNSDNDYSTIIEKYKNLLDITEYKFDKNHGPGYARQYGLEHSKGEKIVFLDADDVLYSFNSIEMLNQRMDETNCDIILGNILEQLGPDYYYLSTGDWIDVQGKIYKRKFIEEHGASFPNMFGEEDNSFNQQLYSFYPYLEKIEDIAYVRLMNQDSLTRSESNDYSSKYEYYYSEGYLYTLKSIIKNKADERTIATVAFTAIVRLYNRIENHHKGNYKDNKTFANLKKIISIYDKYSDYLDEKGRSAVVNNENDPVLNCYEYLMGLKTTLNEFIDKYR